MMGSVAFIGLGRQGAAIAARLVEAGHALVAWDSSVDARDAFAATGARIAGSARDAASEARWLIACLPDQAAVADLLFGADAIMTALPLGATVIDHSSIPTEAAEANAAKLQAAGRGLELLDAPVSGGPQAAAAGSLVVWAGGDRERFNAASPLIASYAHARHYMGPSGSGQIAKACHQLVACGSVALWNEALELARAGGLDPGMVARAMAGSAADSLVRQTFAPDLAAGHFPPRSFANFTKDLHNIVELAARAGLRSPLADATLEQFATKIAALFQSDPFAKEVAK